MTTKRFTMEMPEELFARIDAARGDVPRNRWIRRVIERAVADDVTDVKRTRRELRTQTQTLQALQTSRADAFRQATQRRKQHEL